MCHPFEPSRGSFGIDDAVRGGFSVNTIKYSGKNHSAPGFEFPTLAEYIKTTREHLQKPLVIPDYSAAGEQDYIPNVMEVIHKNPYALRDEYLGAVSAFQQMYQPGTVRAVPYQEYPKMYQAALFMVGTAKEFGKLDLLIQIYQAASPEDVYQASAISYLDKGWIYVSEQFLKEPMMLNEAELCFLLGHELGHIQCRHASINCLCENAKLGRETEYSADRAGLIFCMKWLMANAPLTSVPELAEKAVLSGACVLDKITKAVLSPKKVLWQDYDPKAMAQKIERWNDGTDPLGQDFQTHPHDSRRILAMLDFSRSRLFYQCLGLEPPKGATSDQDLVKMMKRMSRSGGETG